LIVGDNVEIAAIRVHCLIRGRRAAVHCVYVARTAVAPSDSHLRRWETTLADRGKYVSVRRFLGQQSLVPIQGGAIMANEKQTGGSERGGSGNFANDPQRASEAGKKGGEHSHGGGSQQQQGGSQSNPGGSRGGSSNFANDPERAREEGKKGGEHSRGGK
jgi:hypothetical protein